MSQSTKVTVCVATYRRPELLQDLLRTLEAAVVLTPMSVIVVDNDAAGSAAEVARASSLHVDYVVEPKPGIAAARNAALDRTGPDDDYIVFVDDDERVAVDWLERLLDTAAEYRADIVCGPVISVFADDAPRWLVRGGFLQRMRYPTGTTVDQPATNNTLVRRGLLTEAGEPRFSEEFSMSGGSDTEFFWRLDRAVAPIKVWCDESLVWEDVPPSRANWRFVWRRGIRTAGVAGRIRLREVGRGRVLAKGLERLLVGAVRVAGHVLVGHGFRARDFRHITRGVGLLGVVFDRHVVEYARH